MYMTQRFFIISVWNQDRVRMIVCDHMRFNQFRQIWKKVIKYNAVFPWFLCFNSSRNEFQNSSVDDCR